MHYVPNSTENQHYCTYSDHATQLYPTSANHISKEKEKERHLFTLFPKGCFFHHSVKS